MFFEQTYQHEEDGNIFLTIDAYPDDENAEGSVIAEVIKTPHGDVVTSWHDNSYRFNETVLELIKEAKEELTDAKAFTNEFSVKRALYITFEDFSEFVTPLFKDYDEFNVTFNYEDGEGIFFCSVSNEEVYERVGAALGVEVESIHTDHFEVTGVWIVIKK